MTDVRPYTTDGRTGLARCQARREGRTVSETNINVNVGGYAPMLPPPLKSKPAAIVLAFLLGWVGGHKFYLGKAGQGLVYLLFFWTFVPLVISVIEAIIWLCQDKYRWAMKQGVRVL
jgi:TM2 domain-containing membrane protein YozV